MKNIKQLDCGKWEIYFSYVCQLTGKRKRIRRRIEGTKTDARRLRDELREQAENGELGAHSVQPDKNLSDYLEDYFEYRETRSGLASGTLANDRYILNAIITDDLALWKPKAIEFRHVDKLISTWLKTPKADGTPYSYQTLKTRWSHFKTFLIWVLKRCSLSYAFLAEIEPPQAPRTPRKKRGRALTPDEASRFLAAIKTHYPNWYAVTYTLLATGQRWGSVTALRWVDIENDQIIFAQSHYNGIVKEGNKSNKIIKLPLSQDLKEVLQEHRKQMIKEQHPGLSTGLIFPARVDPKNAAANGYLLPNNAPEIYGRVCEMVKIERVTPHDLRRTFNTWLIESGTPGAIIRSITGHSSLALMDSYYRQSQDSQESAVGVVSTHLGGLHHDNEPLGSTHK